jgi:transposase
MKGRVQQMSGSKYHKQFDPEYKKEMVRLVEELGKSPADVAKDIGVTATSVRRWVKQYGNQGEAAFPGKGKLHPANEAIRKKDKRIKELEEENAILKKAMSIFAKDGK